MTNFAHIRRWVALMVLLLSGAMALAAASARADQPSAPLANANATTADSSTTSTTQSSTSTLDQANSTAPPVSAIAPPAGAATPPPAGSGTTGPAQPSMTVPGQADAAPPAQSHDGAPPPTGTNTPAQSNTTMQAIWQAQTLGCYAHCQDTRQGQSAEQHNQTVEAMPAAPQSANAGPGVSPGRSVTQIQLGCLEHCYGRTTPATDPRSTRPLLPQPVPELPPLPEVAADQQNLVNQTAVQAQDGQGTAPQTQTALQSNLTVQGNTTASLPEVLSAAPGPAAQSGTATGSPSTPDSTTAGPAAPASLIGDDNSSIASWIAEVLSALDSPLANPISTSPAPAPASQTTAPAPLASTAFPIPQASAASPPPQAVNQVEQAIWQIQLGCLIFCVRTDQTQQAAQSDTTIFVLPSDSAPGITPSATTQTYQLTWQLQVGCLFWCYDTVESQSSTTTATTITEPVPAPPSPATNGEPSAGSASPPNAGPSPTSGSPSGDAASSPPVAAAPALNPPEPTQVLVRAQAPVASLVQAHPALIVPPIRWTSHVSNRRRPRIRPRFTRVTDSTTVGAIGTGFGATALTPPSSRAPAIDTLSARVAAVVVRAEHGVRALARPERRQRSATPADAARPHPDDGPVWLIALLALLAVALGADAAWRRYSISTNPTART